MDRDDAEADRALRYALNVRWDTNADGSVTWAILFTHGYMALFDIFDTVAQRMYIAGVLPNEPENGVRWIMDPPATDSKTAMLNRGVTEGDARDIAEYLYNQR